MQTDNTIQIYIQKPVFCVDDIKPMIVELTKKLDNDNKILSIHSSDTNKLNHKKNELILQQLIANYYSSKSLQSHFDEKELKTGWFVWNKDFNIKTSEKFDDIDSENTYIYKKYFSFLTESLNCNCSYIDEAIICFKYKMYHACSCLLFTSIEHFERKIHNFPKEKIFHMKEVLKECTSMKADTFNKTYFIHFEESMNTFLSENFYHKSLASDVEPAIINRNRVMHGIFTRKTSDTDCLKLFVLLNSLIEFDKWINSFRNIEKLKKEISLLEQNSTLRASNKY